MAATLRNRKRSARGPGLVEDRECKVEVTTLNSIGAGRSLF